MSAVKVAPALEFRAHQGLGGLQRLSEDWVRLLASMPAAGFNHRPDWYRAYLTSGDCDPASVWFIAAYRNEQLAAICPLQYQRHRIPFLRPRYLGTLDGAELQLSDFVFAPSVENASVLNELTRWLRTQRALQWDVLRLLKVSERSSLGYAAQLQSPGLTLAAEYDASAWFDTSGTYEQATRAMTNKMRSNLRRRTRLAELSAPLRFQSCQKAEEVQQAFDIFLDLESSGWKGPAGRNTSIRCMPSALAFYTQMVREFATRNECVINLLWHGERAIAGQLGLHLGRTVHILKVGHRHEHPALAPGILLQDRTIRHACDDPTVDVLSMVNNPQWVHGFKPDTVKVSLYCASNWSAKGLFAFVGLWLKRSYFARAPKSNAVPSNHT